MVTMELSRTEQIVAQDWRFADFLAESLGQPVTVDLVIENLDHPPLASAAFTYCG